MVLGKEEIWERLRVESKWITSSDPSNPTDFFASNVAERKFRFIVAIWVPGNLVQLTRIQIFKKKEDGTYDEKWSPIPVAPADFRQIPKGYSIEDPILGLEGGTNLAASVDIAGNSLNMSVAYWDSDI